MIDLEAPAANVVLCDEHQNVRTFPGGERRITLDCFYCWALTFALPLGYYEPSGDHAAGRADHGE
jgi:hypothetical protein